MPRHHRRAVPYSDEELFRLGPPPPRTGRQLDEIAFPLGGIGTGCVSLGGWGQLRDWEIRNRPAKGFCVPQSFFTLHCAWDGGAVTRVLQGPVGGRWSGDGHSLGHGMGEGLPHFGEVSFDGRFPIATVYLSDQAVPLRVELEAFNPFIPLNEDDSSLPVAVLIYRLINRTRRPIAATVYGNLANIIGERGKVQRINEGRAEGGIAGLWLTTAEPAGEDPALGTMTLVTTLPGARVLPRWQDDHGHRFLNHFWEAVNDPNAFPPSLSGPATSDVGTVAVTVDVPPRAAVEAPFLLAWHFPVYRHWQSREQDGRDVTPTWLNGYATVWRDAWAVASYTAKELGRLREETTRFRDTLFASTLPSVALDAISSQISILKSPTCLRLTDGTFYGFEGCSNTAGCCEGSCTHVWNYAQALPYLFPALQRSMREADWQNSLLEDGWVTFRMPLPLGTKATPSFLPCADGQMGTVIQVYREWLISGDTAWLKRIWPAAKRALEFAWVYWDADRDGLMEGLQHNTYDNEWYGANTMCGSLYLAALRAGEIMARVVGDGAADEYRRIADSGARLSDERLFNGEYYEQEVNPEAHLPWPEPQRRITTERGKDSRFADWPAWQFGKGCLADQLLGQWYADMLELGDLYDPDHIRAALQSIFDHNWRADLSDHACTLRVYAVGEEAGMLIGTWPRGERPGDPFWFADEVWCGIEYQVASHLIYRGMVREGLAVVKGVRDRYTGERRNPWDEIECGHHYARSMASYALLTALSGFHYHGPEQRLAFAPRLSEDNFQTFFSVGSAWGLLGQRRDQQGALATIEVRWGELTLRRLDLDVGAGEVAARLGRRSVGVSAERGRAQLVVRFDEPVTVVPGTPLRVTVSR